MSCNIIELNQLSVKLGEHLTLEDISLCVPDNAFVAIVGPNGAGKTTFIKVLLGLVSPYAGSVKVFNRQPPQVPPAWVGYVPQVKTMDRSFPALSIELVFTGLSQRWPWRMHKFERQKVLSALEQVGAAHLAHRPLGRLSGGELQRVCLARGIVRQPKLLILDEPATGIDAVGEADLYNLLERYQKNSDATILIITHDWHTATHHADHVLLLNRQLISFGAPQQALHEENLRRAYGHIGHEHELKFLVKTDD